MADTNTWVLDLSTNPPDIYNSAVQEHAHNALQPPYPANFWYVNAQGTDVVHKGELDYHSPCLTQPYPRIFWFTNSTKDDVIHNAEHDYEPLGACNKCTNLSTMIIPKSVKHIGSDMATNTSLTSVTIASDCEYSSTSFPDDCIVNFYP